MKKVFLFLYPINEYFQFYKYYETQYQNPLEILNQSINQRYRNKGYEVVFALFPDTNLYGINKHEQDQIIYTDITLESFITNPVPVYPNEQKLINQIGNFNKIVLAGFHETDCVKRVAQYCYQQGYDTLIDIDLTDNFFVLAKDTNYFKIDEYNPIKLKEHLLSKDPSAKRLLTRKYQHPMYNMNIGNKYKKK
ncbi:MAG: hypothetical protein E7184_02935 [Erysipelotrichaceae bacterium]|nr:hypothetical protein [Erysipelotrichaceae bacterium]